MLVNNFFTLNLWDFLEFALDNRTNDHNSFVLYTVNAKYCT